MYQSILLPVGLSERNEATVEMVQTLVDPKTTVLTLLHVVETVQAVPFEELAAFYQTLRDKAEAILSTWMKILSNDGFDVSSEIIYGHRTAEIISYAREHDVDLIVLRSHVLDGETIAGGFGTLSHQVALLAPCSVLLVRS